MLKQGLNIQTPFILKLSFEAIIEKLEKTALTSPGEEATQTKKLLKEIAQYPELRSGITESWEMIKTEDLVRRLLVGYFPPELTQNEIKAVCIPFVSTIFNLSGRFKKILAEAGQEFDFSIRDLDEHQFYVLSCCIILNEIYGTRLDFGKPMFYDIPTSNGVIRHYRILYNADFLNIYPTENSISLTEDDIDLLTNNYDDLALWKSKFPPNSWILHGFAIMTLYDATVENAVSIFKEKLIDLNAEGFQESMSSIFQSIFRIPDLKIGYTIFNQEENKFNRTSLGGTMKSFIVPNGEDPSADFLCANSYQSLIKDKNYFAISDTSDYLSSNPDSPLANHFLEQGINSFILAPIVKNQIVLGVLEVVSPRTKELNSITAHKLEVVMPFLTDKIDRLMVEIENEIQAFIQDHFTTLHQSVNWKFRLQAKKYLSGLRLQNEQHLEEVVFTNVYPLYGQVDVKGSSETRNLSVQKDLELQLKATVQLLKLIHNLNLGINFEEEINQVNEFILELDKPFQADTEHYINEYLGKNIDQKIRAIQVEEPRTEIQRYFSDQDEETGLFHTYRRKYEKTISKINQKMADVLDNRQEMAQEIFPHYYERFKSDGVEHNLYIGSSIAPQMDFDISKLNKLRFWQLKTICEMENAHQKLLPNLPYPLEVTSLILVFTGTISIRFRMDEKRFDVDGSYNARFEIVKKRIDKACIKNTTERITESGKVTIVYSSPAEQIAYLAYIEELKTESYLTGKIENFEIEDLQGVSGLKGLRVKILRKT